MLALPERSRAFRFELMRLWMFTAPEWPLPVASCKCEILRCDAEDGCALLPFSRVLPFEGFTFCEGCCSYERGVREDEEEYWVALRGPDESTFDLEV